MSEEIRRAIERVLEKTEGIDPYSEAFYQLRESLEEHYEADFGDE